MKRSSSIPIVRDVMGEGRPTLDMRVLGAVAGSLGAVIFLTVFTLEGWLRPGYESRSMFVSELSLGTRGFVQILNFLFLGVSQLLFARGLAAEFPDGKASRAGPIVLGAIGFGFLAAGVFVADPIGTPLADLSWHGLLHGLLFPWYSTAGRSVASSLCGVSARTRAGDLSLATHSP